MHPDDSQRQLLIQDIKDKFIWTISIRYLIAGLGYILFLFSYFNLTSVKFGLGLVGFVAAYNVCAHAAYNYFRQVKLWQIVLLRSIFQSLDIFSVTFLIYITGWMESPYWFFYLVLIILSGFGVFSVYSAFPVFLIALFSTVLYLGLMFFAYLGWLPVYGPTFTMTPEQLLNSIYNKAVFTTITFFLFASTVYYFSKLLSQHRDQLLKKNEELLAALDELKEVDRIKDEFVSTASHELRTPLAVIRENASLINDGVVGAVGEKQRQLLTTSLSNIDRLAKILDNLLDIAKIESRSVELKCRSTDIGALALKAIELLKDLSNKKGISLESRLSSEDRTWVDPDQVLRVFINLIDNAIKYTGEGGRICVVIEAAGGAIRASVEDNGIGIPEEDQATIFERFVRLKSGEAVARGSGLGLSICKAIVEMHKGRLWVESRAGQGSKFIFILPKVVAE
jgi:signal transduction histidine kinase